VAEVIFGAAKLYKNPGSRITRGELVNHPCITNMRVREAQPLLQQTKYPHAKYLNFILNEYWNMDDTKIIFLKWTILKCTLSWMESLTFISKSFPRYRLRRTESRVWLYRYDAPVHIRVANLWIDQVWKWISTYCIEEPRDSGIRLKIVFKNNDFTRLDKEKALALIDYRCADEIKNCRVKRRHVCH
jgi:hypothetical protein